MIEKLLNSKFSTAILVCVILSGLLYNVSPCFFYTSVIVLASLLAIEIAYDSYIFIKRRIKK